MISDTRDYLADPTIAFGPDNRIWVAWRAVEGGVFVSREGESHPTFGYVNMQTPSNGDDATKQFWGLWIATEYLGKAPDATTQHPPSPHGPLTFANLRWHAVEVPRAAASARVRFNLFSGVLEHTAPSSTNGFGPDLTKDGAYRIYVKSLDGAGNASRPL